MPSLASRRQGIARISKLLGLDSNSLTAEYEDFLPSAKDNFRRTSSEDRLTGLLGFGPLGFYKGSGRMKAEG